jgi:hypothetical protein
LIYLFSSKHMPFSSSSLSPLSHRRTYRPPISTTNCSSLSHHTISNDAQVTLATSQLGIHLWRRAFSCGNPSFQSRARSRTCCSCLLSFRSRVLLGRQHLHNRVKACKLTFGIFVAFVLVLVKCAILNDIVATHH